MNRQRADIVVGIPTRDEAATVRNVAEVCSEGLRRHFPRSAAILVNADSASSDGTPEAFLSADTWCEKVHLASHEPGKGRNVRRVMEFSQEVGARAVALVDADLKSIRPDWMDRLLSPLHTYDFVAPHYRRHKYDAGGTNHLCYPLLYAATGARVRQPIGGDFAFTFRYVDHLLRERWSGSRLEYGVDIFMTMTAILAGFSICQACLGAKDHREQSPANLETIRRQVVGSMFDLIVANRERLAAIAPMTAPVLGEPFGEAPARAQLDLGPHARKAYVRCADILATCLDRDDFARLTHSVSTTPMSLDRDLWCRIVPELVLRYARADRRETIVDAVGVLTLARTASFQEEVAELNEEEAEALVEAQADEMFACREPLRLT